MSHSTACAGLRQMARHGLAKNLDVEVYDDKGTPNIDPQILGFL